jgi:hypothetical protein
MAPAMPAPNKNGIQKLDTVTDDAAMRSLTSTMITKKENVPPTRLPDA